MRKMLLYAGLLLSCASCIKEKPIKRAYGGFTPEQLADGWTITSPEAQNMDRTILDSAYRLVFQSDRYLMAKSLLVIRNGQLVAEAYPKDANDRDAVNNIQSCTKSFTSVLTGIALKEGLLTSTDQKISEIYAEAFSPFPEKKNITIRHALTMQTGLQFDNDKNTLHLYQAENSIRFILSREKQSEPGTSMNYNDGSPHLLSAAIQKRAGLSFEQFAQQHLFSHLGIKEWKWEKSKDGINFGAFGLHLKPRDLAKFGKLLLQKGQWENRSLIDSNWIHLSTGIHTYDATGRPYGFYFWIYPDLGGYAALGHGGQFVFVVPQKQLVVVYTAWPYTSESLFDDRSELMKRMVRACN